MGFFDFFKKSKTKQTDENKPDQLVQRKRSESISVEFNDKKGYIISSLAVIKGMGARCTLYPAIGLSADADISELVDAFDKAFTRSREAGEVVYDRNSQDKYWDISGIKSYKAFSKKYKHVSVRTYNDEIIVERGIYDPEHGGYSYTGNQEDRITLEAEYSLEDIVRVVIRFFKECDVSQENSDRSKLENQGKSVISYVGPCDDLDFCGDGGTDAYAVYEDPNTGDHFEFLIDNGFKSFDEKNVRLALERQYGDFSAFSYNVISDERTNITAENHKCRIESSIFHKNDDYFVSLLYQDGDSKSTLTRSEYNRVLESLEIKWVD